MIKFKTILESILMNNIITGKFLKNKTCAYSISKSFSKYILWKDIQVGNYTSTFKFCINLESIWKRIYS